MLSWRMIVGSSNQTLVPDDTLRERLSGVAGLAATALDGVSLLDEVRYQALHDPLTDLANPRLFEDRVTQALAIARRRQNKLAMLFVDLDRFKSVNDTHGHKVGDEVLRAVAERLVSNVRDEDTVARIGGDEFGILVQGPAGSGDAEVAAQRIVIAIVPSVRPSMTSRFRSERALASRCFPIPATYDSVVSRADSAMYQAKAEGRGRFRTFQPSDDCR